MKDDLVSALIWIGLALISVIASAVKNKAKKQQASQPNVPRVPRTFTADKKEFDPVPGPLMDLFDIPREKAPETEYDTIEKGPGVEDGSRIDTEISENELSGMNQETGNSVIDSADNAVTTFEEGQSDIQKMIARYEAIRKELDDNELYDDIASGEIVSVEAEESAKQKKNEKREFFDARKAIIYTEILKRREY